MIVQVEVKNATALESIAVKLMLEKLANNFDRKNLKKISELSEIPNANVKIDKLFNNPFFKAAL